MSNDAPEIPSYGPTRSRLGSRSRMVLTLFDQGIVSIATFLTGVLISRATKGGAGLYALVFTLWVLGGEMHNSLVSTPQMLKLPRLSASRARRFNGSLLIHQFTLSAAITAILFLVSGILYALQTSSGDHSLMRNYAFVTLMAGVSLAPLAFRNFARNHCLATRDIPSALTLDVCVSFLQLGGVAAVYFHGQLYHWWIAVVIVAASNLFSALLWLSMARRQFDPSLRRALNDFRRNWSSSRFIFASSMVWFGGMYLYPWMISSIAGLEQNGIWLVCFALANLGNPLTMGVQNYMGPAIAHAYVERDAAGFRRYVLRSSMVFVALVLPACLVMAALSEFLITHINGHQYAGNGRVTAILVFTMLLQGVSFPTSRGLFSLGRARLDMLANVPPLIVLGAMGALLIGRYGIVGAAVTLIIAQTLGSATRLVAFAWVSRPKPIPSIRFEATPTQTEAA